MTNKVWISCNACGADAFTELSNVDGWHIGRCNKCSMIYLNPMPFFEPSTEFSDMSMDFQYTQFQHELSQQVLDHDNEQFHQHVKIMSQLAGHDIQPGKFLDIGCGSGSTVRVAKDLGWEAVGVDIDTKLIELGREKNKVDIRNSPLLESGFEANQFDFIRLRDVIEHLPNPYEVLLFSNPANQHAAFTHHVGDMPDEHTQLTFSRLHISSRYICWINRCRSFKLINF